MAGLMYQGEKNTYYNRKLLAATKRNFLQLEQSWQRYLLQLCKYLLQPSNFHMVLKGSKAL